MWPCAAINLHHLLVFPSLCFSLCFHISLPLLLRPTSPSSLSNSILLESKHMSPIISSQPSPPRLLLPPRFPLFPLSLSQLLLHLSQSDSSRDWCSYQSQKPSLVRDDWTQRRSSPLTPSLFYLSRSPSFNKFVPVNKPSKMTPSS